MTIVDVGLIVSDIVGDVEAGADVQWDIPRPAATCRHLVEAARRQGIGPEDALAGTGVTVSLLEDNATEVQALQELAVVRNILARVGDSHRFAVDVGLQYNFANMGILGYTLLASPTLGEAIDVACRYAMLSSTFLRLTRTDTAAGVVIEFDDRHVPADVRQFMMERDLYAITTMAPLLIARLDSEATLGVELAGIDFPAGRLEFNGVIVELDAGSSRTAMTIPNDVLALPMPAADAETARLCVTQCEELLQSRRQRRGLAAQVRARLIRNPGQLPAMAEVAAELCITPRTLHRRLAAEQTSYRLLVDEVRTTLAAALLESGLNVEETARRLGYSETAAFTRAFTRWSGEPPSRYRAAMAARGSAPSTRSV